MADCTRNCKRISGASGMKVSSTSVSTSKRSKKEESGMKVSSTSVSTSKRSKKEELGLSSPSEIFLETRLFSHLLEKAVSPATSLNSGGDGGVPPGGELSSSSIRSDESLAASRSCSNDSCEIVKDGLRFVDLEAKSFETEISTCINKFSREATPSSELRGDSEEMDSAAKKPPSPPSADKKSHAAAGAKMMPSQAEIDEFFAVSDQYEQKRFAKKYNYDIVKDLPLEGRCQWVRLN